MNLTARAKSLFRLQDYGGRSAIDGVELRELKRYHDDGGSFVELLRLNGTECGIDGFELRQINYSAVQPGTVKAFHVHAEQTDVWFVRPEDRMLVVLVDVREGSPTADVQQRLVLGDGKGAMLHIPPGVAHGCSNLGSLPASLIYFTDHHFSTDPDRCDEGRLPWDFVGPEVWDIRRE